MRLIITIFLVHISCICFSQKTSYTHPTILNVYFFLQDFKSQKDFDADQKMFPGIAINYLKGINSNLDWSLQINGSFPDSAFKNDLQKDKSLFLQTGIAARARFFSKEKIVNPFLSLGFNAAYYKKQGSIMIPFGPGIEFNYRDFFVTVNIQYQLPLTHQLNSSFHYSLGIGGIIAKRKKQKSLQKPNAVSTVSDKDGDGLIDSVDNCPDQPGLLTFHGCPDTDSDGIMDKEDKCPQVFGIPKYIGCPVPDTDKDGINDEEDECLVVIGISRYKGCPIPDTDKDGVNDEEDKCIEMPGPRENFGCPLIKKELTEKMKIAAKNIFFKTGSYELLPKSYPALDEIVGILKEQKDLKLLVEGHTDGDGTNTANQVLSERRAKAVVDFIIGKGIDSGRLNSIGYGEEKPLADNSTIEGRATNRRVELKLYFY